MHILLVSATLPEMDSVLSHLEKSGNKLNFLSYQFGDHTITPIVTGVGSAHTAFAMAKMSTIHRVDIAVNIGIAGSYDSSLSIGDVVRVKRDRFADLAIEYPDGKTIDVYNEQLAQGNVFPYIENGWLYECKSESFSTPTLTSVTGITVNTSSGSEKKIQYLRDTYHPQVESMEGAAFFYACNMLDIPSIQLRAISNDVMPRNKELWNIPLALNNLGKEVISLMHGL
ncbi:MAG: futalosine hydrolase [Saprospiraceae bacterium]|nr:futalosine hydrolase [Saprospiraceae bacterium]